MHIRYVYPSPVKQIGAVARSLVCYGCCDLLSPLVRWLISEVSLQSVLYALEPGQRPHAFSCPLWPVFHNVFFVER